MKKSLFALAAVLAFATTGSTAFAYQIPGPVVVDSASTLGTGEVDFSRPSVIEGTFSIDRLSGEEVYLTAGDVAGGAAGYGFIVRDDALYVVSSNGGDFGRRMHLGFVFPGQSIHVKATYTPYDAIRIDTDTVSSVFQSYSRGIVMDFLPTLRSASAFSAKATRATASVNSWSYAQ